MELIAELYEEEAGDGGFDRGLAYRVRKAARAVVRDREGRIALLHVTKQGYHKLPGGGVEDGEQIGQALKRELLEEAGVDIEVMGEVGVIVEYRDDHRLLQISYCFCGDVSGEPQAPAYTEEERENGFELIWTGLDEAVEILEQDRPADYSGGFIRRRDLAFLRKAREIFGR